MQGEKIRDRGHSRHVGTGHVIFPSGENESESFRRRHRLNFGALFIKFCAAMGCQQQTSLTLLYVWGIFYLVSPMESSNQQKKYLELSTEIDWASKNEGLICWKNCTESVAYFGGFCSAIASFVASVGCATLLLEEPTDCGSIEGPFWGLAAFCTATVTLERVCDRLCKGTYSALDVFRHHLLVNSEVSTVVDGIRALSAEASKRASQVNRVVNGVVDDIKNLPLHLGRHDKILNKIRYVTFLFTRLTFTDGEKSQNRTERLERYLATAVETPNQMGIVSLLQAYHAILVGDMMTTIFGKNSKSLFAADKRFCAARKLADIEQTMFSLVHQMNFVYGLTDNGDCAALNKWVVDLRSEQLKVIKRSCQSMK